MHYYGIEYDHLIEELTGYYRIYALSRDENITKSIQLASYTHNLRVSFLAPQYHLDRAIDFNNKMMAGELTSRGYINLDEQTSLTDFFLIEFQSVIISIKTLLDRIVRIIEPYYKGISPHTTFGRVSNQKTRGFMSEVIRRKDNDEFMNLIHLNYIDWIFKIVPSRDRAIHYNDLPLLFQIEISDDFDINKPIPVVFNSDIGKKVSDNESVSIIQLREYVDKTYKFVRLVFENLKDREIKKS